MTVRLLPRSRVNYTWKRLVGSLFVREKSVYCKRLKRLLAQYFGVADVVLTSSGEVKAIVLLLAVLAAILVGAGIIYGAEHWSKHAPENKEDKDDE